MSQSPRDACFSRDGISSRFVVICSEPLVKSSLCSIYSTNGQYTRSTNANGEALKGILVTIPLRLVCCYPLVQQTESKYTKRTSAAGNQYLEHECPHSPKILICRMFE